MSSTWPATVLSFLCMPLLSGACIERQASSSCKSDMPNFEHSTGRSKLIFRTPSCLPCFCGMLVYNGISSEKSHSCGVLFCL
ncbi:hypothetical protein DPMN_119421 [Dreissena polymorpha]|uniref:Secreted protein n=1 Tax=Dreissena polymorpha TaxID=45954 RepID=A0A9D4JMS8_DREPO|nr:hypothetical protein DPMN_119421 [Dreissena polymorpha]